MKKLLIAVVAIKMLTFAAFGQVKTTDYLFTEKTIESEVFNFKPVQREGVTDQKFNYALRILGDTKSNAKSNPQNLNV